MKKHAPHGACLVSKQTLALFNLTRESQGSSNHKTCVIPLDWLIQSDFTLDDSLFHCKVWDELFSARPSVHGNKDHFEESSFCQRSIHRTNNSEFEGFLNRPVIIKLIIKSPHNHKNSVKFEQWFIRQLSISDIHLNHLLWVGWINYNLRTSVLFINNSYDRIQPLLEAKRGVKEPLITPSLSPRVRVIILLSVNPR